MPKRWPPDELRGELTIPAAHEAGGGLPAVTHIPGSTVKENAVPTLCLLGELASHRADITPLKAVMPR